jgi:hypothetical protein
MRHAACGGNRLFNKSSVGVLALALSVTVTGAWGQHEADLIVDQLGGADKSVGGRVARHLGGRRQGRRKNRDSV